MNWFNTRRKVSRKSSGKRKVSATKRRSSSTKRRSSSAKRKNKVCFVNGKPRAAIPKTQGTGYYYTKKTPSGKTQKHSVTGRTYTKTEAIAKARKLSGTRVRR